MASEKCETIHEMKTAAITGASSGIGAATARALAADGYRVVLGARRLERLQTLAAELGGTAIALDVTDADSIHRFVAELDSCEVLVNNAGGALGLDSVEEADDERWRWMYEANVLGTMRMTRELLPALRASGDGHVVGVTSIAAFERYRGGAGYSAAKHAQRALLHTLRLELLGEPVRITEVAPGWSRRSSRWFVLAATRRQLNGSTRGWSRCAPRTLPSASVGPSPSRATSTSTR